MEKIIKLDSVSEYNSLRGFSTNYPLVSILDLSKAQPMPAHHFQFNLYAVFLKEQKCGELKYGRSHYDYQEGTLVFVAPGQLIAVQPGTVTLPAKGWALLFHPDFVHGTSLGKRMHEYSFFSYDVNEALHVSEKERQMVLDCFSKIQYELEQSIDKHSKKLIASNIELFLDYCIRFYDRQFITRDMPNKGVIDRFDRLLSDYLASDKPLRDGLPTVGYCAKELNLSANYFGDLVRRETGQTAQEIIQAKVISVARERIFQADLSISELAYGLGFKYPQHFTRLFKQKTGMSPVEYRSLN